MAKAAQAKSPRKWTVTVQATFTQSETVEVQASTKSEASKKALEMPVNFDTRGMEPDNVKVTDISEE
jgi:hypothetical protein